MQYFIYNLNNIQHIAHSIIKTIEKKKIILFHGQMGTGKTTLIKEIIKIISPDIKDEITSPTFTLLNSYKSNNGFSLYHADLFRINDESIDFLNIEDIIRGKNTKLFVEWPTDKLKQSIDNQKYIEIFLCYGECEDIRFAIIN